MTHPAGPVTSDPATALSPKFFFSSRRRHTSWTGDWSSDVCSSDLEWIFGREISPSPESDRQGQRLKRSEERRVGKECRFRGAPDHCKETLHGLVRLDATGCALREGGGPAVRVWPCRVGTGAYRGCV